MFLLYQHSDFSTIQKQLQIIFPKLLTFKLLDSLYYRQDKKREETNIDKNAGYSQILLKKGDIKMKNGTENKKVVFDIIFNLICMIYIIYSWMSLTNVGVVTALTHNHGDAMLLIVGAAIVLIVFFIIDIISLISGKKQRGYLLPGYVGVSIGVKCIAILFLVFAYVFKLRI